MALLDKAKAALRIDSDVTIYDDEIKDLIAAALLDLSVTAGVKADEEKAESDALIRKAVITYCRTNFGDPDNYDKLKSAYDEQKAQLKVATGYTEWSTE